MTHRCHLCGGTAVAPLLEMGTHPIAHRLLATPDEAEYTHHVTLGVCEECSLAQLIDPIPAEQLYTQYNWLSAWKRNPHLPRVIELIEALPGISADSLVVDVGSNDGSFLAALRERGFARGVGVEPAGDAAAVAARCGIETLRAYFTRDTARDLRERYGPCDLLVARQVVEHVPDLREFAAAMREVMRPGAHVFVEVPDFDFNLAAPDYSAIWEEHVNHFTRDTLEQFLAAAGVAIVHTETAVFSGQVLMGVGVNTGDVAPEDYRTRGPSEALAAYRAGWPRFRDQLRAYLAGARASGKRIAVYGAGCRACCLINFGDLGEYVDVVVDDETAKQGTYMPGSRLPVRASDRLEDVDLVLLAVNAENEERVIARHTPFIARGGQFASIHPPSPRLPPFWRDGI